MNKIAIYALLAAGIAFTSCDEVEDMTESLRSIRRYPDMIFRSFR